MSLINEALLDLQAQHRNETPSVTLDVNEPRLNRSNTRFVIVALGLIAVTGLMYIGLQDSKIQKKLIALNSQMSPSDVGKNTPQDKSSLVEPKKVAKIAPKIVSKTDLELEATEKLILTEKNVIEEQEKAKAHAIKVATMITKLEITTARNRLSLPKGDNALFYLAEIKALDPDHSELEGLYRKVQRKFITQLEEAIEQKNKKRIDLLFARAPLFHLDENYLADAHKRARNLVVSHSHNVQEVDARKTPHGEKNITKSLAFLDKQAQQNASTLVRHGRHTEAEHLLEKFITEYPNAIDSTIQLFNLYLDDGDVKKSEVFVANLAQDHPAKRYFRARIAKRQYGENLAISLLENHLPENELAPLYQSFLAGLYQQQKQYYQAQQLYKTLLQEQPDNRQFLLGFGLSSDALNENDQARWAFEKVHQLGHANPSVMQYIQQRLKNLAGNQLVENQLW